MAKDEKEKVQPREPIMKVTNGTKVAAQPPRHMPMANLERICNIFPKASAPCSLTIPTTMLPTLTRLALKRQGIVGARFNSTAAQSDKYKIVVVGAGWPHHSCSADILTVNHLQGVEASA